MRRAIHSELAPPHNNEFNINSDNVHNGENESWTHFVAISQPLGTNRIYVTTLCATQQREKL
jgi:hypothetical protein